MNHRTIKVSITRVVALLSVSLILSATVSSGFGQSGRKQKRPEAQPPVQGVNQPETRVVPEPEVEAPKPRDTRPGVLVASDIPDISIPIFYTDIARQACILELREGRLPDISEAKSQNRVDAINKAKDSEIYVVLLELRLDSMGPTSANSRYSFDLRYTLFEPKTGKIINSGAGYPARQDTQTQAPPLGYDYDQRMVELMGRDAGRKALKFIVEREAKTTPLSILDF